MIPGGRIVGLPAKWREAAETLEVYGASHGAQILHRCADELEATLQEHGSEPLTLQEASDLSGYSSDHLGRLVREGKIPNAGRKGAPRIAREHVPTKAGTVAREPQTCEIDRTQIVRSAIKEGAA